jgi:hypothetical protein
LRNGASAEAIDSKALWLSWADQENFMTGWKKSIRMILVLIVPEIAEAFRPCFEKEKH